MNVLKSMTIAAALAICSFAGCSDADVAEERLVTEVRPQMLIVAEVDGGGEQEELSVASNASILRDGQAVMLTEIQPGDVVQITREDDQIVAIAAASQPGVAVAADEEPQGAQFAQREEPATSPSQNLDDDQTLAQTEPQTRTVNKPIPGKGAGLEDGAQPPAREPQADTGLLPDGNAQQKTEGRLLSASGDQVVLRDGGDRQHTFQVGPEAEILLDGESSSLDQLTEGMNVIATSMPVGDQRLLTKLAALSLPSETAGQAQPADSPAPADPPNKTDAVQEEPAGDLPAELKDAENTKDDAQSESDADNPQQAAQEETN